MALLAGGLLENVYASLDAYLQETLLDSTGVPLAIRLHGVRRFVPPIDDPWIEIHYDFLGVQSQFQRYTDKQNGVTVHSVDRRGYLQLNIYQRARVFRTRYTTAHARDLVVTALPEGHIIPIRDYAHMVPDVTPDEVGLLVIDGLNESVNDTGQDSGITQHMVQCSTRYLEPYTRP